MQALGSSGAAEGHAGAGTRNFVSLQYPPCMSWHTRTCRQGFSGAVANSGTARSGAGVVGNDRIQHRRPLRVDGEAGVEKGDARQGTRIRGRMFLN